MKLVRGLLKWCQIRVGIARQASGHWRPAKPAQREECTQHAPQPLLTPLPSQADLRTLKLNTETFGTKFDVIIVDPPWDEYARRAPQVRGRL